MKSTSALLSRADRDRIRRFITLHEARLVREQEVLALLSARVERARIAEDSEVPHDVVTMYSQVRLRDDDSGRPFICTAALPPDEQIETNDSLWRAYPFATLLGARAGEDIEWPCAGGLRRAHVEQVLFQPEVSARQPRECRNSVEAGASP